MERNENYDELLRRKISETLGEPIDGSMNADDLMFDLGMRYLRLVTAEKKYMERIRANQLSLCAENGWIPISMKNDWLTVFGEDVTKKDHFTQDGGIIGE